MAYSKTPAEATQQTKRVPVIAGQTVSSDITINGLGQRFTNCYPKREKLGNTDDKWVLTKRPSLVQEVRTFASSGTDPITCVSSDGAYIWKGRRLYETASTPTLLYTGPANYVVHCMYSVVNPVDTDNLYAGLLYNVVDGETYSYTWNATDSTFTLSAVLPFDTILTSGYHPNATAYMNGRLYVIGAGGRIYNCAAGDYVDWNTTYFIVPESKGDTVVGIAVYKNHIAAFSQLTLEFFYDAATDIGSPLQRQDSYTQTLGVRNDYNIVATGDLLYFLSWDDKQGYAVGTLDNYQAVRISNLYVDALLSNEDVIGEFPHLYRLCTVDFFGDTCLYMYHQTSGLDRALCYSSKQKLWFDVHIPFDLGQGFLNSVFTWSKFSTLSQWLTYVVTGDAYGTNTVTFWYFAKDYNSTEDVTAIYIEDMTDLGSQATKHFSSIYFVGDPGNNTVLLYWTPNMSYQNWIFGGSRQPTNPDEYLRWDNLGGYRRLARQWQFLGTSNIAMEGSEIRYNLGSG